MPRAGMGLGALALLFAWGFAEATVFFIVADVAVSWIALGRGLKDIYAHYIVHDSRSLKLLPSAGDPS
jgi:membrane protein YqaA with SNARE-associated domain